MTTELVKEKLINDLNVSRETIVDLETLVFLLEKWNKTINLVGKSTIEDVWTRHILDSAQLWQQRPENLAIWLDIGSGAGFPGLVLAILAKTERADCVFHMIESDARKCAFLRNVSRETSLNTKIHTSRIEDATAIVADVVSARALATVEKLAEYSHRFLCKDSFCLFLKGQGCATEVENAHKSWEFESEMTESLSDDTGVILKIWNLKSA
jgi:16S rRNA (guanine527-N7)-methyltransferase